jgi:V/A-type H+-transporting ATPase subunit I
MLRPLAARWFEVLVAQDDVAAALEALAATGAIELEVQAERATAEPMQEVKPLLDAYAELAQRYGYYWPTPAGGVQRNLPAREALTDGLQRIEAWRTTAEPVIRELQELEQEERELAIWQELLARFRASTVELGLLRRPDSVLARRLYVFPPEVVFPVPDEVMTQRFMLQNQSCVLVLGPQEVVASLDRQATALKGRRSGLGIPGWLEGKPADNVPRVAQRKQEVERAISERRGQIATLDREHELPHVLAQIERLRWFATEVHALAGTDYFAWLTGWTDDFTGERLKGALARAGVRALLRFPPSPKGTVAPLVLANPWWARPFELFAKAIGVPSRDEIDPSPLLAAIVPLLFGYMFGDVGQGLVLLAAGVWLRKRFAIARLLIAGGASAIVFGFLFGSVFSREDLIPALWLHPLGNPLTVLAVPLLAGAVLLALGLVLSGIESYWRGEMAAWIRAEAGMFVAYLGLPLGLAHAPLLWIAAAGLAWYVVGHALHEHKLSALFAGLGAAIEHGFQLAVNTLSFARVGAFALAHAGLSSAIVSLADAADNPIAVFVIMLIGNVVVIVLEGLVVSIQTTRLVLFEFFIRFLRGEGRAFRPLAAPRSTSQGDSHEKPA